MATDCDFKCPDCACDLSEYLLIRKLVVVLGNQGMKRYVFQTCDSYSNVDALRAECSTYEAARRDTGSYIISSAAGTTVTEESGAASQVAAMAPRLPAPPRSTTDTLPNIGATILCRDCGDRHALGRSTCFYCGKIGHLKKCCRSLRRLTSATQRAASATPISEVSIAVTIADTHHTFQHTINVSIAWQHGKDHQVAAVADTGAQVCVASASLLSSLGINPSYLQAELDSVMWLA